MQLLVISIWFGLTVLARSAKSSIPSLQNKEEVLMRNISDLHFQLFSSIQERAKIIKTAVFETQCSESGCTFNVCNSKKPTKLVCSPGWKWYNGHCYYLFSTNMNWFEAQMFCRKQGATLLQINDARESKWLSKKFPKVPYWIDLTDVGKEGTWMTFSSGKGPTFTAWAKGQPDNSGGKQHCAYNNWTGRSDWDDGGCTYKTQVMCELSGSGF